MLKRDKNGAAFIRVRVDDPALLDWYDAQADRGKSVAVAKAWAFGASVTDDGLQGLKDILQELMGRLDSCERLTEITQVCVISHQEKLDMLLIHDSILMAAPHE